MSLYARGQAGLPPPSFPLSILSDCIDVHPLVAGIWHVGRSRVFFMHKHGVGRGDLSR
jgi:hypothetical protein